jgi:hypothetical protein
VVPAGVGRFCGDQRTPFQRSVTESYTGVPSGPTVADQPPATVRARDEVQETESSGPVAGGVDCNCQREPCQRSTTGVPGELPVPTGTRLPTARQKRAPRQAIAFR